MLAALICLGILFSLSGCGGSKPAKEEETIAIRVKNSSEDIIISWAAFFGEGLDEWGEELLGDEVIEPGDTFEFILPEGVYNVALFTYEYYVVYSDRDISTDTEIVVGGGDEVPVLFENRSAKDIIVLFISPSEDESWGEDWLDEDIILAETGGRIFFLEPGIYDIMALNEDEEAVIYLEEIDIVENKIFTLNE